MMAAYSLQNAISLGQILPGGFASSVSDVSAIDQLQITGLTADSRKVVAGGLFCACSGINSHGMAFAEQAVQQGAVAILCEVDADWPLSRIHQYADSCSIPVVVVDDLSRQLGNIAARFFNDPSPVLKPIGITGTNGKTSCAWFLAQLSSTPCAMIGTLGNGFISQLDESTHTTPGAVEVQQLLEQFRHQGAGTVAMEVSSHALSQHRVNAIQFGDALFTNLSRDHLDYHGDMQRYGAAKASLFECQSLNRAVINLDDPFGAELIDRLPGKLERVGYSLKRPVNDVADYRRLWAEEIHAEDRGMQLKLDGDWGVMEFHAPLLGHFNAANLLGVLAVLLSRGESPEKLIEGIGQLRPVPGRMQVLGGGERPTVVVDYAHTPDALEQVLRSLRMHTHGRLICLFGCGGERDTGKRPLMGAVAENLADQLIITDDNPRHEDGRQIIQQILAGIKNPAAVRIEPNRARAIHTAITQAAPADLVLVAGKGHEGWQQIGDLKHPFDDATEVNKVLNGLSGSKSR